MAARGRCPECGSGSLVEDAHYAQQQLVCAACGCVLSEGLLTTTYSDEEHLREVAYSQSTGQKEQLSRCLQRGIRRVQDLCKVLQLPAAFEETAVSYFQRALQLPAFRLVSLERKELLGGCCVLVTCRQRGWPLTMGTVCSLLYAKQDLFAGVYLSLQKELGLSVPALSLADLVTTHLSSFRLLQPAANVPAAFLEDKEQLLARTMAIVELASQTWLVTGRHPVPIVTAAAFLAWQSLRPGPRLSCPLARFCRLAGVDLPPPAHLRLKELLEILLAMASQLSWLRGFALDRKAVVRHVGDLLQHRAFLLRNAFSQHGEEQQDTAPGQGCPRQGSVGSGSPGKDCLDKGSSDKGSPDKESSCQGSVGPSSLNKDSSGKDSLDKGSPGQDSLGPGSLDKDCLNKGSLDKGSSSQGPVGSSSLDKDSPGKDSLDKGSPDKGSSSQGPVGSSSLDKDSPGKDSLDKDSPDKGSSCQGSVGSRSLRKGSPGKDSLDKGSPGKDSLDKGSPDKGSSSQGSVGLSSLDKGSPGKDSLDKGSPGKDSLDKGSPGKGSSCQGSVGLSSLDKGSPGKDSLDKGSPGKDSLDKGSPGKGSSCQGSVGSRSLRRGSPGQGHPGSPPGARQQGRPWAGPGRPGGTLRPLLPPCLLHPRKRLRSAAPSAAAATGDEPISDSEIEQYLRSPEEIRALSKARAWL